MTRTETLLTLKTKAKVLQELIDDLTAQLREVEVTIWAVKVQEEMNPNFVPQPVQLAPDFSALTTGGKPDTQPEKEKPKDLSDDFYMVGPHLVPKLKSIDLSAFVKQSKQAPQWVKLEGPITEEPERGTWYFLKTFTTIYSFRWVGCKSDYAGLKAAKVYPHTPGGAAGAMMGYKPEPNT